MRRLFFLEDMNTFQLKKKLWKNSRPFKRNFIILIFEASKLCSEAKKWKINKKNKKIWREIQKFLRRLFFLEDMSTFKLKKKSWKNSHWFKRNFIILISNCPVDHIGFVSYRDQYSSLISMLFRNQYRQFWAFFGLKLRHL